MLHTYLDLKKHLFGEHPAVGIKVCSLRGVIRQVAEKCYYITLLLSIAMKIHR